MNRTSVDVFGKHEPARSEGVAEACRLPKELCVEILLYADLSADELVRCARSLSKSLHPLAMAARDPAVWKPWHPMKTMQQGIERRGAEPDFLVNTFLDRHKSYSSDLCASLRRYRNEVWQAPPVERSSLWEQTDTLFHLQMMSFRNNLNFEASLPRYRIKKQDSPETFDLAMALLRHRVDPSYVFEFDLPLSLRREKQFFLEGLSLRPSWFSQANELLQKDGEVKREMMESSYAQLVRRGLREEKDGLIGLDVLFIPMAFVEELHDMQAALTLDAWLPNIAHQKHLLSHHFRLMVRQNELDGDT